MMTIQRAPLFITFEGGEGCGKTAQVELFYPWFLESYGICKKYREPGGEPLAEKIRELVLDKEYQGKINEFSELLLFEAARAQFVSNVVKPVLSAGVSVLCDRFSDSTPAYQGYGNGINLKLIDSLNNIACQKIVPDLTFIIDVNPVIGLENVNKRGKLSLSRIDSKPLEYHQRVNQGFGKIAENNPDRCVLIPYQDGIENVQAEIRKVFSGRYL